MIYVNGRFLTEEQTGVQRFALNIVRALSAVRSDIVLLAPDSDGQPLPEGVRVQRFGSSNPFIWEQFDLPRWLRKHDVPLLLNLANRAPVLYGNQLSTLHDLLPMRFRVNFSRRFRVLFRLVARVGVIRGSRQVITVSDFARREIEDYYRLAAGSVAVVPNAGRYSPRSMAVGNGPDLPFKDHYVLAFGRPGAHRNAQVALEAFKQLPSDLSLRLVYVGSPDPDLVEAARSLGSRCAFVGRVSDDELSLLYRGATCFVAPSLYEGFDLPALEAQSAGVVVVASDIPVHREVLGAGAFYFSPRNSSDLAAVLQEDVLGAERRYEVISAGETNARRFDWHDSAARLDSLIEELIR